MHCRSALLAAGLALLPTANDVYDTKANVRSIGPNRFTGDLTTKLQGHEVKGEWVSQACENRLRIYGINNVAIKWFKIQVEIERPPSTPRVHIENVQVALRNFHDSVYVGKLTDGVDSVGAMSLVFLDNFGLKGHVQSGSDSVAFVGKYQRSIGYKTAWVFDKRFDKREAAKYLACPPPAEPIAAK